MTKSNQPLNIFIGVDRRQPIAFNVLQQSIWEHCSLPVRVCPLVIETLPIERRGLTDFTFSRFLVPWLCDYKGWGLFIDADFLLTGDISQLFALADESYSIMVTKPVQKFERASLMLFNNEKCKVLTPEYIEKAEGLHAISFFEEKDIGELPQEWNFLVGYQDKPDYTPKCVHYTQGIPAHPETMHCDFSSQWHEVHKKMNSTVPWVDLMGSSVHTAMCNDKLLPKFYFDLDKKEIKPRYKDIVHKLLEAS